MNRLNTALFALGGTAVASFLPGFIVSTLWTIIDGGDQKLGVPGTIAVLIFIWTVFTVVTLATCLVEFLPLFLIAQVGRPVHAFWLAVAASLPTALVVSFGEPPLAAGVHLVLFTGLCMAYRAVRSRGLDAR